MFRSVARDADNQDMEHTDPLPTFEKESAD
jgi:hypothetical protein